MKKREVFVRLLDEGTPCFRPTLAEEVQNDLYRLLSTPDYDREDEEWELKPGALVRLERRSNASGDFWLAIPAEQIEEQK